MSTPSSSGGTPLAPMDVGYTTSSSPRSRESAERATRRLVDIETSSSSTSSSSSSSSVSASIRFNRAQLNILPDYPPPRTTTAAALLLVLGTFFLIYGGIIFFRSNKMSNDKGLTLFILGGIMFLPGSYASFIIFGAWMRWRGFDYSMVPSYDD